MLCAALPQVAKALAQRAVDQGVYVVKGPVFSGSINASMVETKRAEIPNFTDGETATNRQQVIGVLPATAAK